MRKILCFMLLLSATPAWGADIPVPVASDSRIKTFVYSENDVFNVVTHYGFESNIEFGREEEVETISVGDRVGFQIVPSGRRIFIRPQTVNARTNMTVVTNKHAYQFDLVSVPTPVNPNEELAYVVRFFYPGDKVNAVPVMSSDDVRGAPVAAPAYVQPAVAGYNYNYTFSGNDTNPPVKIYDDGSSTYFKFHTMLPSPKFYAVGANGTENLLQPRQAGEYWVVDSVSPRITVRQSTGVVNVFNEKLSHP